MAMYKKNKVNKVFVRLSDEQVNFLDRLASDWELNRSEVIRIIIDSSRMGGVNHENEQTNLDN